MKTFIKTIAFTAIAAFALTSAFAKTSPQPVKPFIVTFDPITGTGFVGKGDVQSPFGWNNAKAQAEATNVTFTYDALTTYEVTIEFTTGNPDQPQSINKHIVKQGKSTSILATIASDPRKTGQWTGWNLTGLGGSTTSGEALPQVNDPCPNGNIGDCKVISVEVIASTGGLYAHWNGRSILLQ